MKAIIKKIDANTVTRSNDYEDVYSPEIAEHAGQVVEVEPLIQYGSKKVIPSWYACKLEFPGKYPATVQLHETWLEFLPGSLSA